MENSMNIQEMLDKKAKRKSAVSSVLPFVGLIFITVFLIFATEGLIIKQSNLLSLINQCFTVCIVGVGAAFVYGHGGMDFSIGASAGLAQYVSVMVLTKIGLPVYVAILASIVVGIIASTTVGSVSILLRVPPFVTSLCIRAICMGILALGVNAAGGEITIDYNRYEFFNNEFLKLGILIFIIGLGYFLFEKTALGKSIRSIGGNITTAFQAGVKINKIMIFAYSILGFCVGLAAFFQMTRVGGISANSGGGLEFDIMIALILGGFPMAGGTSARLRAVIIGAITITILTNGLIIWGLDVNLVNGLKGLLFIIIVALSYDRSNLKQVQLAT